MQGYRPTEGRSCNDVIVQNKNILDFLFIVLV